MSINVGISFEMFETPEGIGSRGGSLADDAENSISQPARTRCFRKRFTIALSRSKCGKKAGTDAGKFV